MPIISIHIFLQCCQSLSEALRSPSETSKCIVPRILFLDNYFCCQVKSSWQWAVGDKMHTLGCLMLQTLFKYPIVCSPVILECCYACWTFSTLFQFCCNVIVSFICMKIYLTCFLFSFYSPFCGPAIYSAICWKHSSHGNGTCFWHRQGCRR